MPQPPEPPEHKYVPALGFHWLTPFYDLISGGTVRERTFKRALIDQADLEPGQRVLDLGAGTGTLTIWIKQHLPQAEVVGVDYDPAILAKAVAKARESNLAIRFDRASSFALPYPAGHFDRALSSLFFHHLTWDEKVQTAEELFRVLKPNAELHVADWGAAANPLMRGLFLVVQLFDGFRTTRDNVAGRLVTLFEDAGFVAVRQRKSYATMYGTLALYSATRPGDPEEQA